RVVEVLVSSVKATELMFGKIIGIALVALTQFVLWIVLTGAIVAVGSSFMGKDLLASMGDNPAEMVQGMGVDASAVTAVAGAEPDELGVVLTTLGSLPIGKFILIFIVYFIFGYMLYASLFAAIGSAVENEGDTQQLQLPVTIPLMIGYFIAIYAFNAPDSSIAFWGSMIPFTSPIVMLARTPFGVPGWEYAVSIALLVATFALCAWLSAKIYKVGILMFGKKSTWKDLWKWLKQK
ncbi:MAG: ABC transporter permease, partial [Bacteroidales bacterium]|nr:ABC transporter permease [Bacteroidales bacterium]